MYHAYDETREKVEQNKRCVGLIIKELQFTNALMDHKLEKSPIMGGLLRSSEAHSISSKSQPKSERDVLEFSIRIHCRDSLVRNYL